MKKIIFLILFLAFAGYIVSARSNKVLAACPSNCPSVTLPVSNTILTPPVSLPPCATCTKPTTTQPRPTSAPTPTSAPSNNSGGGNSGGPGDGRSDGRSDGGSSGSSSSSPAVQAVLGLSNTSSGQNIYLEFAQLIAALILSLGAHKFLTKKS